MAGSSIKTPLHYQSIIVPLPSTDQAHLTRFYRNKKALGQPVFLLHSNLEDGSTFFNPDDGSGLAPFLARHGYDVYVADLRGKGQSWPRVSPASAFGYEQLIGEDIPAMLKIIASRRPGCAQIWISHGWGAVLQYAYYARFGTRYGEVAGMVHFGARRLSHSRNWPKTLVLDGLWKKLLPLSVKLSGYLPASAFYLGSNDEPARILRDYLRWTSSPDWPKGEDGFDYGSALRAACLPPSLFFATVADKIHGDLADMRRFIAELAEHDTRLILLGRERGSLRDYSHRSMLSHPDCEQDHFPLLLSWIERASGQLSPALAT